MISEFVSAKRKAGKKMLAVLIDPEKTGKLDELLSAAEHSPPDLFLVGGSSAQTPHLHDLVVRLKKTKVPIVLFPGHPSQMDREADAVFLLSLISGRNAEYLIGQHVSAAFALKESGLDIIPTGYILIEGGKKSTTAQFTQTEHLNKNDHELIVSTALAGTQLGMRMIYLEAGSGAPEPVPVSIIRKVRNEIDVPLIVGGGIKNAGQLRERFDAGADIAVIGNILEHDPSLLLSFVAATPLLPI